MFLQQSIHNDLEYLNDKVDTKIQKETHLLGDLFETKETGVYYIGGGVKRKPADVHGFQFVTRFHDQTAAWNSMYFAANGEVYNQLVHSHTPVHSCKFLTTLNTIVDANGFIKTA